MVRRILHIDLDAFFVAAEMLSRPDLRGKAVIVGGDPDGRGVVSTASYEARVFGVSSGMALRTAKRLAPQAVFLRGDFQKYSALSAGFHAILSDFTPLVESGGLDEAYLDITGCELIIGQPLTAAETIRKRVQDETGLAASVGIAGSKLVAKVASDRAKPDGVVEVADGGEAAFLAPLPLRALPMLGPSLEKRLRQIGLSSIGQLAEMSVPTLTGLLGRQGSSIGQRARGIDSSAVAAGGGGRKSVSREGTFNTDVVSGAKLRSVLRAYSESVGSQLREQQFRARTVSLKLRFADFTTISRSVTLSRPANSDDAIFTAAAALLTKAREGDGRPVRLLGVGGTNLVGETVQLSLVPAVEERQESLSAAFDRVRNKYGKRSLQTGRTAFQGGGDEAESLLEPRTGLSSQIE